MASQHMTKAAPPLTPTFLVLTFPAPRIVLIRMNRPAALNAMSTAAQWEMDAIWKWFDDEPTLSVAIITGTGRAFSAGADLKDWNNSMDSNADPSKRMGNTPAFTPLSRRLGKKPVIAAVNGLAMGGGCEFVVNCDLVIAAEEAVFGLPEVKRGIAAIGGALPRLIRTIGLQRASEFALTGRNVTAREMEAWGIVNKVVSRESLIEEAGFCLSAISAYIFLILPTNVLTYINADIGPSPYISWVNIARTLGLSFCYTILGRLSDLFGRRWFFIGGNCVALIGIIVCAAAPNVNSLIIGAAIYGVGETVQLSFNVAIGELVPNKYRPMVLSFVFLTNAPIATFGPIIARKFVNTPSLGWRWCFYINIICVGLTIILLYCFYHPPTFNLLHERKTKRQLMRELDYLGIFLWTAGLTLLLMGVSWGGNMYPWKSAATISSLIIGASLLVALFFWEGYADLKYPAIPIKFFLNRGWFSLVICATVASMFYYSAVLLWPQQVQALYTRDITYAGWLSTTVASSTALGQIVAGAIVKWGGNVRYWIIFSTFAMVGFVGALASLTPETKNTGIALTIIGPFFVGFIELAALALAPLYCKPADIGLASGLLASIRSAGGSVAVAVYTTILANRLSTTIPSNIAGPAIEAGLPADQVGALAAAVRAGKMATFPGITDSIQEAVRSVLPVAYSQAFKTVYLASLGFGGIAIVGCLFSKDAQKHLTDRVERRMGDGKRKPELEAKTVDDDPRRESREIQEGA
ncbi:hypothetical protein D7B24_005456 [Verticillium nonalfalfae]|uniref:Major facilitator superfamily (MFS) profile domain-containing protein n=1 Tax=Verticillium nonalfalfae TaxID=1051616 RepID=A0A3M9YCW0_9PEZI|nr:uncharacterized protein D7B24_005456 [Verticillium nonalfalfae]RNJ57971.1 hypothetical protein D7B24_005456 [Verticillium nonalfalfae]